jgi:hypothetical protein
MEHPSSGRVVGLPDYHSLNSRSSIRESSSRQGAHLAQSSAGISVSRSYNVEISAADGTVSVSHFADNHCAKMSSPTNRLRTLVYRSMTSRPMTVTTPSKILDLRSDPSAHLPQLCVLQCSVFVFLSFDSL